MIEAKNIKKEVKLDYLNWLKKEYAELGNVSDETINAHINSAKMDSQLFREFIKVLGFLIFVVPFNLYLSISGVVTFNSIYYWLIVIFSSFIGVFVALYCEQTLIKKQLKKTIRDKHSNKI